MTSSEWTDASHRPSGDGHGSWQPGTPSVHARSSGIASPLDSDTEYTGRASGSGPLRLKKRVAVPSECCVAMTAEAPRSPITSALSSCDEKARQGRHARSFSGDEMAVPLTVSIRTGGGASAPSSSGTVGISISASWWT